MADKQPAKKPQLTLEEYQKIKDKRAKSKLKLHIPPLIQGIIAIPVVFLVFLVIYYLVYIRFLAEH